MDWDFRRQKPSICWAFCIIAQNKTSNFADSHRKLVSWSPRRSESPSPWVFAFLRRDKNVLCFLGAVGKWRSSPAFFDVKNSGFAGVSRVSCENCFFNFADCHAQGHRWSPSRSRRFSILPTGRRPARPFRGTASSMAPVATGASLAARAPPARRRAAGWTVGRPGAAGRPRWL